MTGLTSRTACRRLLTEPLLGAARKFCFCSSGRFWQRICPQYRFLELLRTNYPCDSEVQLLNYCAFSEMVQPAKAADRLCIRLRIQFFITRNRDDRFSKFFGQVVKQLCI